MKSNKSFYIYILTNVITEKWYVGKTYDVKDRWTNHKSSSRKNPDTYIHRAIQKYGEENFLIQTVAEVPTEEEAYNLEKLWITLLRSHDECFGYNLTFGGVGVFPNKVTRKKMGGMLGKKHSQQAKDRVSLANKDKKLSAQTKNKISLSHTGLRPSDQTKQKLSVARKRLWEDRQYRDKMLGAQRVRRERERKEAELWP